jgi:signal transduction histidine kinase
VHIGLAETDEGYRLAITDNGAGFDPRNQPAAQAGSGLGLAYMRERIERLGGRLTIASAPGQGTQLVAELPA